MSANNVTFGQSNPNYSWRNGGLAMPTRIFASPHQHVIGTKPFGTSLGTRANGLGGYANNGSLNLFASLFPENTIIGKLLRQQPWEEDFVNWMDLISGRKLAYDRSLEERAYLENYNSPSAQVARMLAAGLNPYSDKVTGISSGESKTDIVPDGETGIAPYLFNGINQALSSIGDIPENLVNLKQAVENIKGQALDNLEKKSKLGLDANRIRAEIRKLDQQFNIDAENNERERERFEIYKNQAHDSHEEHLKRMVTYDDNHQMHLHNVSQWELDDLLKQAQLRALDDSHNQNQFVQNYLNHAQLAQVVAQTNHLLRMDSLSEREFKESVRQFNMSYEQAEKWRKLDREDKLRIQNLEEQLLSGQISKVEYDNALDKYGLSRKSLRGTKQDAGLVENLPNPAANFSANVLDTFFGIPSNILGGIISVM